MAVTPLENASKGEKPQSPKDLSEVLSEDAESTTPSGSFISYKRIFTYTSTIEKVFQLVAALAALISGAAIALQALVFGEFITIINSFVLGQSSPAMFRSDVSALAQVFCNPFEVKANTFSLYFVYLGIGRFFLSFTFNFLFTYAAHRVVRTIRCEFLRSALSQEIAYYDAERGTSIATQGSSHGNAVQAGISEKLGLFIQASASILVAFVVALSRQWKLTLICICIAPATLIIMGVVGSLQSVHHAKMTAVYMQAGAFVEEVLGSIRTIQAFSIQKRLVRKYDSYLVSAQKIGRKLSPLLGALFSSQFTIFQLGMSLGFWQGIRMIGNGEIEDTGDVFIVLMSVILASTNLSSLAPLLVDFSAAGLAAAELYQLIDRTSLIDPLDPKGDVPGVSSGHVTLENVNFAYPTRPDVQVLSDFTLDVLPGKTTAIVGPSGSGKSTIIGLIERWYSPKTGSIKLDRHPIQDLNLNWLRSSVRLVQQQPVLFHGTVFENIKHGLSGTPLEHACNEEQTRKIHDAAQQVFAHDFIMELPKGYETLVGQGGSLLSGGQKQRIAIARAIVSDPKVLLLDEATSALDPHAEGVVQAALDRVALNRTTVTISHKLSTIYKADNIVVMSQGAILEQGTHEALMATEGTYHRLVHLQSQKEPTEEHDGAEEDIDRESSLNKVSSNMELPLARYASSLAGRVSANVDRHDFDKHKQLGLLAVFARILKENRTLSPVCLLVLAACLGGAAVYPAQAILMASTVEVFTEQNPAKLIQQGDFYASMFVVLAAGCLVSYFTLGYTTNIIAQEISRKYRKQGLEDVLLQDIQFFDQEENSAGALSSRIDGYATNIIELTSFKIGLILIAVFSLLACSALALVYSWKLGLVVVFAGLPPLVASGYLKIRVEASQGRKASNRYSNSASLASESILSLRTVSSLAIEVSVLRRYKQNLDDAVAATIRPLCLVMACFGFMQAVEFWFLALGLWYGCRLLSFGEVGMYDFMVAFLSVFLAGQAAGVMFQFTTNVTAGLNGANYLFWLHGLEPDIQATPENLNNAPGEDHSLQFNDLHFSYPLRPNIPVLRGVNLSIQKGQFIGFVGASGCGKSTMVAMLERFYDPVRGEIKIGPDSLHTVNPARYRRIVALVQQEPTLFAGTIRENVSYGIDDGADEDQLDAQVEQALRAANAWHFTCSLPSGLSTNVGPGGSQLSGGQRQRIAIARALARNPRILLLDEATSALDTESERVVQDALSRAATGGEGRITIAIAHRLSTVRYADLICVFFAGRIAEMGAHEDLMRKDGMYRRMCEAQALD